MKGIVIRLEHKRNLVIPAAEASKGEHVQNSAQY